MPCKWNLSHCIVMLAGLSSLQRYMFTEGRDHELITVPGTHMAFDESLLNGLNCHTTGSFMV